MGGRNMPDLLPKTPPRNSPQQRTGQDQSSSEEVGGDTRHCDIIPKTPCLLGLILLNIWISEYPIPFSQKYIISFSLLIMVTNISNFREFKLLN